MKIINKLIIIFSFLLSSCKNYDISETNKLIKYIFEKSDSLNFIINDTNIFNVTFIQFFKEKDYKLDLDKYLIRLNNNLIYFKNQNDNLIYRQYDSVEGHSILEVYYINIIKEKILNFTFIKKNNKWKIYVIDGQFFFYKYF